MDTWLDRLFHLMNTGESLPAAPQDRNHDPHDPLGVVPALPRFDNNTAQAIGRDFSDPVRSVGNMIDWWTPDVHVNPQTSANLANDLSTGLKKNTYLVQLPRDAAHVLGLSAERANALGAQAAEEGVIQPSLPRSADAFVTNPNRISLPPPGTHNPATDITEPLNGVNLHDLPTTASGVVSGLSQSAPYFAPHHGLEPPDATFTLSPSYVASHPESSTAHYRSHVVGTGSSVRDSDITFDPPPALAPPSERIPISPDHEETIMDALNRVRAGQAAPLTPEQQRFMQMFNHLTYGVNPVNRRTVTANLGIRG